MGLRYGHIMTWHDTYIKDVKGVFNLRKASMTKEAQVWVYDVDSDDLLDGTATRTFGSKIKELYELEYKRSMMKVRPFSGVEKRKDNMLAQLDKALVRSQAEVKSVLLKVFKIWLGKHQVNDVAKWSENAQNEYKTDVSDGAMSPQELFESLLKTYIHELSGEEEYDALAINAAYGSEWEHMIQEMKDNIEAFPIFKTIIMRDLNGLKNEVINENTLEDFNMVYGGDFYDAEEARQWVDNFSLEDYAYEKHIGSIDELARLAGENGLIEQLYKEMQEKFIFPAFSKKWKGKGIDKTIERIDGSYQRLLSANDIDSSNVAINLALLVSRQTGEMIDHVEQYLGEYNLSKVLDEATQGSFVEKANKELRMVGVQI